MRSAIRQDKDALFRGKLAKKYDLFSRAVPHHDEFQQTVGRFVYELVVRPAKDSPAGAIIAECGTGTGLSLGVIGLQTRGFRGIERLYAVDISPEMIRICARRYSYTRIKFVTADFDGFLKTHKAALDGVYSVYAIHNLAQKKQLAIFRRIYGRLRPGGWFVDGDIFAHSDPTVQKLVFERQLQMFRDNMPAELAESWISHNRQDSTRYFILEELCQILTDIGFRVSVVYRNGIEAVIVARKQEG